MSDINYQLIGSCLEQTKDQDELAKFRNKFKGSTDSAMASLATYASFRLSSLCLRVAGRINEADLAEMNAYTVHERDIKIQNRWGARRP